ncbi:MAG: hypothetical protein AVDCRST_MAG54-3548 [uncultured Actinomycetospora sp.]|uniref:ANTAR domain-containing protein n=1 Tax=uncultured Actinomycetospora sp. TaxID=1135996 RepID=A0A6J4JHH2_9PSEU|nr:MAG: hypothetical protein AVDCRST_MAG54-3548 [uncultured Actinomycetospora sp.]
MGSTALDLTGVCSASISALLLHGADTAHHLQKAVDSRDLIGQAKGILMERFSLDDEAAFRMLVKSSQDTDIELTDVARWLTGETGNRHAAQGVAVSDGAGATPASFSEG